MSLFITFEGIEGSGKTSRLRALMQTLRRRGCAVTITREPGGCPLADAIRAVLLQPDQPPMTAAAELLLYLAARAQHMADVILPTLAAGGIVLCDRFSDATLAYQGYARGLDLQLIRRINDFAASGHAPAATLLFDLPVEEGLRRSRERDRLAGLVSDRLEQETYEFHRRVREGYLHLAAAEPQRFHLIDAAQPPEDVDAAVIAAFDQIMLRFPWTPPAA